MVLGAILWPTMQMIDTGLVPLRMQSAGYSRDAIRSLRLPRHGPILDVFAQCAYLGSRRDISAGSSCSRCNGSSSSSASPDKRSSTNHFPLRVAIRSGSLLPGRASILPRIRLSSSCCTSSDIGCRHFERRDFPGLFRSLAGSRLGFPTGKESRFRVAVKFALNYY